MINKLNIKTCLITGATGGVGQSITELLRKKYRLIIVSKDLEKLKLLKNKLNKLEDNTKKIECIRCDFAKINEVYSLIKKIKKLKIDILINNAAIFDINEFDKESNQRTIDVINANLVSHMIITKTVIKNMKKNKFGKIVFLGSTSSYKGEKNTITYCVTKHGILGLSKSLNDEFNRFNVQSFMVSPGIVKTKMSKKIKNQNRNTYIDPKEISEYIDFILSHKNSSFLNEILIRRMRT